MGDIVVGMVAAIFGGWLFGALRIALPFGGLASAIFVAFVGAVLFIAHSARAEPARAGKADVASSSALTRKGEF